MKLNQLPAAALLLTMALPLTGCPMMGSMPMPGQPYPYVSPKAPDRLNGPSLSDAYHDVEKWLGSHYPGARLLSVEGPAVGRSGRSGSKGWTFKYAVASSVEPQPYPGPVFTPSPYPMPLPMPRPTARPKYVLEPGELYGPPAEESQVGYPGLVTNNAVLVTSNAALVDYDAPMDWAADDRYTLPVRKMPPALATGSYQVPPATKSYPIMPRPPVYTPTRYMSITVDGSGRLLAPEDLPSPQGAGIAGYTADYPGYQKPNYQVEPTASSMMIAPMPTGFEFNKTVSLVKLLTEVEDLGNLIGSAGAKVSIRSDAGRGAVVEIDPQVAVRPAGYPAYNSGPEPAGYPTYNSGPEPSDGPYASSAEGPYAGSANRPGGYAVKCMAPPDWPNQYETDPDGVLYRGTYLFNAYTGELLARPARI